MLAVQDLQGSVVDTYCDLHRHCTSLRAITGPAQGRVVGKAEAVVMREVTFRVQPAGLRRARESGVRNVHAYARGKVAGDDIAAVRDDPRAIRVRYNPHRWDSFVRADTEEPVWSAAALAFDGKTAYALLH